MLYSIKSNVFLRSKAFSLLVMVRAFNMSMRRWNIGEREVRQMLRWERDVNVTWLGELKGRNKSLLSRLGRAIVAEGEYMR